jgi:nitrite reductase/ring-hydroxylating ferredoxin subunit
MAVYFSSVTSMGEFIKVAKAAEIGAGSMKGFVLGENRVLVANVEGIYYAIEDRCPHLGANLSRGLLMGKNITCMAHSAKFDVTTGLSLGDVTNKPAKTYEVRVNGEDIEVNV